MKLRNRLISLALCLVLALSLLPAGVLAASANPFADVKTSDWFYNDVLYVYENGLMQGTGKTAFSPNGSMTRGMIVTILHRMEGKPAASGQSFSDVKAGQYYAKAVAWASANKIVKGYGSGTFGPNDPITREQLVSILYRYAQYKGCDVSDSASLSQFSDANAIHSYAKTAMAWAKAKNLIQGVTKKTIVPQGGATRAQAAAMLKRFRQNILGLDGAAVTIPSGPSSVYAPDSTAFETDSRTGVTFVNNMVIVFFAKDATDQDKAAVVESVRGKVVGQINGIHQLQIQIAKHSLQEIRDICTELEKSPAVLSATEDLAVQLEPQSMPNDPWGSGQNWSESNPSGNNWGVEAIRMPSVWNSGYNWTDPSMHVKVGVVDNGFDTEHEDLNGIITYTNDINDYGGLLDYFGDYEHGTHVAGIIGARPNNGKGICGVAWNSELLTWDYALTFKQKQTEAAKQYVDFNYIVGGMSILIEEGARIVNISLGHKAALTQAAQQYTAKVIAKYLAALSYHSYDYLIVQSSGNDRDDTSKHADFSNVSKDSFQDLPLKALNIDIDKIISSILIVGNAQNDGNATYSRHKTSNWGSRVDVMAPGTDILSCIPPVVGKTHNGYKLLTGTSMAAPHVTGVAALVLGVNPKLKGYQVADIIKRTATTPVKDSTAQMINAEAAVELAETYSGDVNRVTIRFYDTQKRTAYITAGNVRWDCLSYSGSNPAYNKDNLGGIFSIMNADDSTTIDAVTALLPLGKFKMTFSAPGYLDNTVEFEIKQSTKDLLVNLTPSTAPAPTPAEAELIVGDIPVTARNAADILGDGTARYDASSHTLTFNNASIQAEKPVEYTGTGTLNIVIPRGTKTTLACTRILENVVFSRDAGISLSGGGSLVVESAATFSGFSSNNANGIFARGPIQLVNLSVTFGFADYNVNSIQSITATNCTFQIGIARPGVMFYCSGNTGGDITLRGCQVTNAYFNLNSDGIFSTIGTVTLADTTVKAQYTDPEASLINCNTLVMSGESSLRIFPGMDAPQSIPPVSFVVTSAIDLRNGLKITAPSGGVIGTDRFGHCVILDADGNAPSSITIE